MSKRAYKAALKAHSTIGGIKNLVSKEEFINAQNLRMNNIEQYKQGYEQAEKDIIYLIESRLSELIGDAQPTPILRYELQDLIKKIKEEE